MPTPRRDAFDDRVRAVLAGLAVGEVVSYGEVAALAGSPAAARAVGRLMASGSGLPWWRVVTRDGRLVPGHEEAQAARLRAEGHAVNDRRVVGFRAGSAVRPRER